MDIRTIRTFRKVYEKRSMNSAAKELFISAQGLGKIIGNLEEELGTVLFERSARGIVPTESAEVLYRHSGELENQLRLIENAVAQVKEKERRLKICCARGILNALSFQAVSLFIEKHPEIDVEWKEMANQSVKRAVRRCDSDIGLVVGHTETDGMEEIWLQSRKVCVLVYKDHPYYEKEQISVRDLDGERIVTLNEQYQVYHDFQNVCSSMQVNPVINALTEDSHFLYNLCRQKVGLGILMDFSLDGFQLEDMKILTIKEDLTWNIYMVVRKDVRSYPLISLFETHMRQLSGV